MISLAGSVNFDAENRVITLHSEHGPDLVDSVSPQDEEQVVIADEDVMNGVDEAESVPSCELNDGFMDVVDETDNDVTAVVEFDLCDLANIDEYF